MSAQQFLAALESTPQSFWLDQISAGMLKDGELERRIQEQKVTGVTSNPTIFQQAITSSDDYDHDIARLSSQGASVDQIYTELVTADIQDACDQLLSVFEASSHQDGFVSVEVSPHLAHETEATVAEAQEWVQRVGRPNLLVKVPATLAGVSAFQHLTSQGVSVNVTLIFSVERYRQIMEAYTQGLYELSQSGGDPSGVASVASFFVSRIDSLVDPLLTQIDTKEALAMTGRLAIANAILAYQAFREFHLNNQIWLDLYQNKGAQIQRPLWASTSTKNPEYPATLYVDELLAPLTINTMPPATLDAFHRQQPTPTSADLIGAVPSSVRLWESLENLCNHHGLKTEFDTIFLRLENEGVQKFSDSFDELMLDLSAKTAAVAAV